MLNRIQPLHELGFVHRDIKPANLFMSSKQTYGDNLVNLIGFNKAVRYKDEKTGEHCAYGFKKPLFTEPGFQSKNSFLGYQYSRRDDIEAIGNVMIYFIRGWLPWLEDERCITKNLKSKDKNYALETSRQYVTLLDLCKDVPPIFCKFIAYSQNILKFDKKPDYEMLKDCLRGYAPKVISAAKLGIKNGYEDPKFKLDWDTLIAKLKDEKLAKLKKGMEDRVEKAEKR